MVKPGEIHYFRLLEESMKMAAGSIVAAAWDGERFRIPSDNWGTSYCSVEELAEFAVEVDEAAFTAYVESLHTVDISDVQAEIDTEVKALLSGQDVPVNEDRTLAAAGNKFGQFRNGALLLSRKAETFKAIIANNARVIAQHAAALKAKAEIEAAVMKEKMLAMEEQMKMLGHALHMANLYLGSGEIVVPIREGDRASASEPIHIRQRLLYMDEEVALLHESGIEATNISQFDEYVMRPEVLDLVLPEKKGIVVLQPCRDLPRYKGIDPITQAMMDEKNSRTYWLIRNGDSLWRFWADFDAPSKIFPDRIQEVSPNRPGSAEYYKQMEAEQQADRLIYMKAGLLVQGIIDRTLIFAPFAGARPSLTDPDSWDGQVVFVYDSEAALGEGRPGFSEWLLGTNKSLIPGQRIVTTGRIPNDEDNPLVTPKFASGYEENEIWTIEADSRGFFFKFPRTDWRARDSVRRGTCLLLEGSDYFINFDAAKEEEFEFYMRSRETRSSYKDMIPLLRRCKELKEVERATEAPFRTLLRTSLIHTGADEAAVDSSLDGLILWWKSKNKNFRPLVGDDHSNSLAFSEIISRFSKRVEAMPVLSDLPIANHDGLALVVIKDPKTAVAFFSADPRFPTFFNQKSFRLSRGAWKEVETKSWIHIQPQIIAHPGRIFINSDLTSRRPIKDDGYLAKPILDSLSDAPLRGHPSLILHRTDIIPYAVIAVLAEKTMKLILIGTNEEGNDTWRELEYRKGDFHTTWKTTGQYTTVDRLFHRGQLKAGEFLSDEYRSYYIAAAVTPEEQMEFVRHVRREAAAEQLKDAKRKYIRTCTSKLETSFTDRWREEQFVAYLKQGGDPSLFEDHIRTVKMPDFNIDSLDDVLTELLFRAKWTIKRVSSTGIPELLAAAKESYFSREEPFFPSERTEWPDQLILPDGFTLPHYSEKVR